MKGSLRNPLREARRCLLAPVDGLTWAEYVSALESSCVKRQNLVMVRLFSRWVEEFDVQGAMSEAQLAMFREDLKTGRLKKLNGTSYRKSASQAGTVLFALHNRAYERGAEGFMRELIPANTYQRYVRFLSLSERSQEALQWFEEHAPRAGRNRHAQLMTVKTRNTVVREMIQFLGRLDRNDLEGITAEDLPKVAEGDAAYKRTQSLLHHVGIFYKTCVTAGKLSANPLAGVSYNNNDADAVRDFLAPDMVERVRDLSTVDMGDPIQVAGRTAMLVILDLALRLNELSKLDRSHARRMREGGFRVHLPSGVQKMQGKPAIDLETLYPETAKMLGRYLKHFNTSEEDVAPLILNRSGGRASGQVISTLIKREADRIGLVGHVSGKTPTPHAFRRTFATVNAAPLGLQLPPDEIASRLRIDLSIAYKHYVQQNPLISSLRNERYRSRAKEDARSKLLSLVSELEGGGVPRGLLSPITAWVEQKHPAPVQTDRAGRRWISEDEALTRLKEAWGSIPNWRAFKSYMKEQGAAIDDRPGKTLEYDDAFVRELSHHQPLAAFTATRDFDWRRLQEISREFGFVKIGHLKLVPPDKVAQLLRCIS